MKVPRGAASANAQHDRADLLALVVEARPADFSLQVVKYDQNALSDWIAGLSRQQIAQLCDGLSHMIAGALQPLFGNGDDDGVEIEEEVMELAMQILR